jgi:hypothetical protein
MTTSRKSSPASERVLMTLLGMSDDQGFIERFKRDDALDYAYTPGPEFERELAALMQTGAVEELDRVGRSARRFRVRDLYRKSEANRYISDNQAAVTAIAAARTRLEPGRAFHSPTDDVITPSALAIKVVRVVRLPAGPKGDRFGLTITIGGQGTFYSWTYQELARGPAVFAPSRRTGDH